MDELDAYFALVARLADFLVERDMSAQDLVFDEDPECRRRLAELVAARKPLSLPGELERLGQHGWLASGMFHGLPEAEREVGIVTVLELEDASQLARLRRSCDRYDKVQPLFQSAPDLWSLVRAGEDGSRLPELLRPDGALARVDESMQLVESAGIRARLHHCLSPALTRWLVKEFGTNVFLRVDPYQVGASLTPLLTEAVLRPADPGWWKKLKIWPHGKKVAAYDIPDCEYSAETDLEWREHHMRKFGRLEVSFRRDTSGTISGSVEELTRPVGPFTIGYYLHLTSDNEVGDDWESAQATHIDGAINVYTKEGEDAQRQRWETRSDGGKSVDATFRTHLFRVDNVPLRSLIPIAKRFFRSAILVRQWLNDQFQMDEPA